MKKAYQIIELWSNMCEIQFYIDDFGDLLSPPEIRAYWAPAGGGYVRDISTRPGTSGEQVCARMRPTGDALYCAEGAPLKDVLRREMKKRMRDVIRGAL